MGSNSSKKKGKENSNPKKIPTGRSLDDTRRIRLLVLHDESHPPGDIVEHFCDALNAYTPPGSLEVKQCNVKQQKIPDSGSLSDSKCKEIEQWISEWLSQSGIVLICLLSNYDVKSFADDSNLQRRKIHVVVFSFGKNPPINCKECVCLDVDLETVKSPKNFERPLGELVATIKAEGQ